MRDHLKTSTRADRQNASYVCTPSDLFKSLLIAKAGVLLETDENEKKINGKNEKEFKKNLICPYKYNESKIPILFLILKKNKQ